MSNNLIGRYIRTLRNKPQCIKAKEGDILKIIEKDICLNVTTNDSTRWAFSLETEYYELLPENFDISSQIIVNSWEPKVGEYAIMEQAGGWGYSPDNNGCVAIIEKVSVRTVDGSFSTYSIDGRILNSKNCDGRNTFKDVPIFRRRGTIVSVVCRKALSDEIPPMIKTTISSLPQEGCVYYDSSIDELYSLSKHLTSRPYNRIDGKTTKDEAIGIGWNMNSCWWLKTRSSGKTEYKLKNIQHLYPSLQVPTSVSLNIGSKNIALNDLHLGSIVSCIYSDVFYDKCLFIREKDNYYLLNNCCPNNDGHSDKSKYKYSLVFSNIKNLNDRIKDIKLLDIPSDYSDIILKKSPYPEKYVIKSDDGIVDLYIPQVHEQHINVDYSVNIKLADIKLPDYSVIPEKIQQIKIETYNVYL